MNWSSFGPEYCDVMWRTKLYLPNHELLGVWKNPPKKEACGFGLHPPQVLLTSHLLGQIHIFKSFKI